MIQFILKFFQAIIGKRKKELYALVNRFRIANLVRFDGREIVLLRRRCGVHERRKHKNAKGKHRKNNFVFHGCFSAGGVPGR